jgi:O-antigen/teichoic acid export membrane protein
LAELGLAPRAARVVFVTTLSTVAAIALQLVSVPVCMAYWGKEAYGSWIALFASFTLLRTAETGYVAYAGNRINLEYHREPATLRRVLSSSFAGMAVIGSLQLAACLVPLLLRGFPSILGPGASDASGAAALTVLVVSWLLTGGWLGTVHKLMIPSGMMYQSAWWSMGFQLCQFAGIMLAARLGMPLLRTALLFAAIQAVVYLASAAWLRRRLPEYFPWWRGASLREGLSDLGRSIGLTLGGILQQGSANAMVLLVSVLSGPAVVAIFATVRTLANLWTTLANVLTSPLLPEVVRFHANREGGKLVAIHEAHWVLVGTAVNLGILASYPLLRPLYGIWTCHRVALDGTLLCLLLASVAVSSAGSLMSTYLGGVNNVRSVFSTSAIRGAAGILGGLALHRWLGTAAFGLSILAGEAIVLALTFSYFFRSELGELSVRPPGRAFGLLLASVGLTVAFLAAEAIGVPHSGWLLGGAIPGVLACGRAGWRRLDPSVRERLVATVADRFLPAASA